MRDTITPDKLTEIVQAASTKPIDPGVKEMLPQEAVRLLDSAALIAGHMRGLDQKVEEKRQQIADLNDAIKLYAQESGGGEMFISNLRLCLDQVQQRRGIQ